MSLALFNTVPVGAIEVLFDCDNQPWFKRAHVGKFLDLPQIVNSLQKLDKSEICTRTDFGATVSITNGWSEPKDQQNKTDVFLSIYGVIGKHRATSGVRKKVVKSVIKNDLLDPS